MTKPERDAKAERDAKILKLAESGLEKHLIAERMGLPASTVRRIISRGRKQ